MAPTVMSNSWASIASIRSFLTGLAPLRHSLCTLAAVSSPESVVRSMHVTARSNQAAWYCTLTVLLVPSVEARRFTAGKFTEAEEIQPRSRGIPAFDGFIFPEHGSRNSLAVLVH